MKKVLALLLAILLPLGAIAEQDTVDPLLQTACMLAQELDLAAATPEYLSLFTDNEEMLAYIAAWGEGDHAEPVHVYRLSIDETMLLAQYENLSLSPFLQQNLQNRMMSSIITSLNAPVGGSTLLAASSIMTIGTVVEGQNGYCLYLLKYEEGADVLVTFVPVVNGCSNVTAAFYAGELGMDEVFAGNPGGFTIEQLK